jgi:predicted nuclease with TOPRIM domain
MQQSESLESSLPPVPESLISGVWELAFSYAQAQVAKKLGRITTERDGLKMMSDSQLDELEMYAEENSILQDKIEEYEPFFASAQKAEEVAVTNLILEQERHQNEITKMQSEIKRINDEASHSKEMMTLSFQIERQTLNSTIDRLNDHLSELKALHISAATPARKNKKTVASVKKDDVDNNFSQGFIDDADEQNPFLDENENE